MEGKPCSRKEWDAWLRDDCVLVTIEFAGRVERRIISKTALLVATSVPRLVGAALTKPIMDVLDGKEAA